MEADGVVDGLEQNLRRLDGTTFPAATTSRLIEYEGEPAFVTSVVDLTERRAAEAEIQRQRETLHQSEKLAALGALLAGVAHELNNPLSVVVGYSSMLQELAQDDASRQRAARVHAAAERCARIVKTFLAMARSRPPQYGPVRLSEVAENALELAGYGLRTADIEIVREFPPELPQVWGDSDQLHQVMTNLIVNAQQALLQVAPPRRLWLRLRQEGGEVIDRGRGQRPRHGRRGAETHLRAVLHHQAPGGRDRGRALGLPRHRHRAWRPDRRGQPARPRHALCRGPAAAGSRARARARRHADRRPAGRAAASWWSTTSRRSPNWWPSICAATASPSRWWPAAQGAAATAGRDRSTWW